MKFLRWLLQFFLSFANRAAPAVTLPDSSPPNVVPEPEPVAPPPAPPKFDWSTPLAARHSVRVICDEEGLTVEEKNTLCATIGGESGWRTQAINHNRVDGTIVSTDFGICQWNDYYHGKEISPTEAMNNPEKAVRLMCHYWKKGETYRRWWIAYKNGRYKQFYDPPTQS